MALVTLLLVFSFVLMNPALPGSMPKLVEGQMLMLRDGRCALRGELGIEPDGAPKLWFYNKAGACRVELGLLADGAPGSRLLDQNETIRLNIDLLEGSPSLALRDREDYTRATLHVLQDGEPYLQLDDTTGDVIWSRRSHRLEALD